MQCASLLLCSTKWSYPLHTLLNQEDLQLFLTSATLSIVSSDSPTLTSSLEWRQRTLQGLFMALLYYGEVMPCLAYVSAVGLDEEKIETLPVCQAGAAVSFVKGAASCQSLKEIALNRSAQDLKATGEASIPLSKVEVIPYSTFIISNTIEYRNKSSPVGVAELQLQKMAKSIYASVLFSLVHPKPLTQPSGSPDRNRDEHSSPPMPAVAPVDQFLNDFDCSLHVFPETVSMLVYSMECLLKKATSSHQLLSKIDLLSVLSLWHECNSVLTLPPVTLLFSNLTPKAKAAKLSAAHTTFMVTSEVCYWTLVDFLLAQSSISPALWQISLVNIMGNLQSSLTVGYDKLLAVLVKLFLSSSSLVDSGLVQKIVKTLRPLTFHSHGKGTWLTGSYMLLQILTTALQKR